MTLGLALGMTAAKLVGVIPNVMIDVRSDRDRYENEVSMIRFPDGQYFRMVHRSPVGKPVQIATIYGGKGKFVRYQSWFNETTQRFTGVECAGYNLRWFQSGETQLHFAPQGVPDIREELEKIPEGFLDTFIGRVMMEVQFHDMWQISSRLQEKPRE